MWFIALVAGIVQALSHIVFAIALSTSLPNQYPSPGFALRAITPVRQLVLPPLMPITQIDWANQNLTSDQFIDRINVLLGQDPRMATRITHMNLPGNLLTERALAYLSQTFVNLTWLNIADNPNIQHSDLGFAPLLGLQHLAYIDLRGTSFRLSDWRYLGREVWVQVNHAPALAAELPRLSNDRRLSRRDSDRMFRMARQLARTGVLDQIDAIELAQIFLRAAQSHGLDSPYFDLYLSCAQHLMRYAEQHSDDTYRSSPLGVAFWEISRDHAELLETQDGLGQQYLDLAILYLERTTHEDVAFDRVQAHALLGDTYWHHGASDEDSGLAVSHWSQSINHFSSMAGLAHALALGRGVTRDDDRAAQILIHMFAPRHQIGEELSGRDQTQIASLLAHQPASHILDAAALYVSLAQQGRGGLSMDQPLAKLLVRYVAPGIEEA